MKDFIAYLTSLFPNILKISIISFAAKKYKNYYERKEARRITEYINDKKNEEVTLVYDYLCSPPTYGDFLVIVLLARYILSQDMKLRFLILNDSYRADWNAIDEDSSKLREKDHLKILKCFLGEDSHIKVKSFNNFKQELNIDKDADTDSGVILIDRVLKRKALYNSGWNLLNSLYEQSPNKKTKDFLFKPENLSIKINIALPQEPYISWHCRKSSKATSQARNTMQKEFLEVYSELKKLYPEKKILIISDLEGCNYFKKIAKDNNLKPLFSKDFSEDFLGDSLLLLNSSFHFISRGGGIDMFSLYSQNSYQAYVNCISEKPWLPNKAHPWSLDTQEFYDVDLSNKIYLPSDDLSFRAL